MNTQAEHNLTTEQGVKDYMRMATSEDDWNSRCDDVKEANNGDYPGFWYFAIVVSGVMHITASGWKRTVR